MRFDEQKVLRRLRKIAVDGEVVTSACRLFRTREAATTNARSPIVTLLVTGTVSAAVEEEPRDDVETTHQPNAVSRARYEGAVSCKQR